MGCRIAGPALAALIAVAGRALADETHGAAAAGMKAYVDPETGELLPEPPAGLPSAPLPSALDRSDAGLAEVPHPDGGSVIHLQGRFQSPLTATIAPDGTLRLRHRHD